MSMKKVIPYMVSVCALVFLLGLFLGTEIRDSKIAETESLGILKSSWEETETGSIGESQGEAERIRSSETGWTLKDFEQIQVGVSTLDDLLQITPDILISQMGRGAVVQLRLEDGRMLEFVFRGSDQMLYEISLRE